MCGIGDASLRLLRADKAEWVKMCSYSGIFVVFLTASISSYWGNVSIYTESYFRERLGPHIKMSPPWLLSCYTLGSSIGGVLSGHIDRLIGQKWTLVAGCLLYDTGLFLSALSVQYSVIGLNLSLGLLGGMGSGLIINTGLQHVVNFRPKYIAIVTAVITSGVYFGSACWNQLVTWYINPANLAPDLFEGRQKYFTQGEVLDRVPSVFSVLGVVFLCCHVLGISMIRPNDEDPENQVHPSVHEKTIVGAESSADKPQEVDNGLTSSKNFTEPPGDACLTKNVSPRQMFKKKMFYLLCYMLISAQYTYTIFISFFKMYAITWIPDDQFLATLSTVIFLVSTLLRPVCGGLMDVSGVKFSILATLCNLCVFSNFWYFTPMVSRWLYFVWTVMYGVCLFGLFLHIPVMTSKLFGTEYFSTNYGIVLCSRVLASFLAPSLIQTLLNEYGWFCLFVSAGCMNAIGVILTMIWLPMV